MADIIENNNTPNYVSPSPTDVNYTPAPIKENIPKGIIGAFIGASVGGLLIFILAQFSVVASICGFVMGYLSVLLYHSFTGVFTKKVLGYA